MKKIIFILVSMTVFTLFNVAIYEKEQLKASGEIVFLELAPVDPRSLMQGDYMRLRYAISDKLTYELYSQHKDSRHLVIRLDEHRVAQFVRYHHDEPLAAGEKLLKHQQNNIIPNSYMFQEGHAKRYEAAKYGVFRFDKQGNAMLVSLADKNRVIIN